MVVLHEIKEDATCKETGGEACALSVDFYRSSQGPRRVPLRHLSMKDRTAHSRPVQPFETARSLKSQASNALQTGIRCAIADGSRVDDVNNDIF